MYYRCNKLCREFIVMCCLSRSTCIVIRELDLLWCPSLIKGHTASSFSLDASKVNVSSFRKSSLGDKWTVCEMWSSRVENKQIALLDSNVLSSLGCNGGSWQRCSARTWGIQLQSREESECDVSAFSCWKIQSRLVRILCLPIAGPEWIYRIQMRTEPLPQLL